MLVSRAMSQQVSALFQAPSHIPDRTTAMPPRTRGQKLIAHLQKSLEAKQRVRSQRTDDGAEIRDDGEGDEDNSNFNSSNNHSPPQSPTADDAHHGAEIRDDGDEDEDNSDFNSSNNHSPPQSPTADDAHQVTTRQGRQHSRASRKQRRKDFIGPLEATSGDDGQRWNTERPYMSILADAQLRRELGQYCEQLIWQSSFGARVVRYTAPLRPFWVAFIALFGTFLGPSWRRFSSAVRSGVVLCRRQWARRMILFPCGAVLGILWCCVVVYVLRSVLFSTVCHMDPDSKYTPRGCPQIIPLSGPRESLTLPIATTNDVFADIIDRSTHMRALPYLIQDSTMAVIKLKYLIQGAKLDELNRLVAECEEYSVGAQQAHNWLIPFSVHLNSLVRDVIFTTYETVTHILGLYADREAKCNQSPVWRAFPMVETLTALLGISPVCLPVPVEHVASHLRDHIGKLLPEINALVNEADPLLESFNALEKVINGIQKDVSNKSMHANQEKANLVSRRSMWERLRLKLGGPPLKPSSLLDEQLKLMEQVPQYMRDGEDTVSHASISLTEIVEHFQTLADRMWNSTLDRGADLSPDELPSKEDLKVLSNGLRHLIVLYRVADLKSDQDAKEVYQRGSHTSALYDYHAIKAGATITYGTTDEYVEWDGFGTALKLEHPEGVFGD